MTDRRPRTIAVLALLAALALPLAAPAAAKQSGAEQGGAEASPTPALTWAPLVTPPPIVIPGPLTPQALADGYVLGAADAPVEVQVWEDFQCPFCRRWAEQVKPLLIERYILPGEVRLVFRPLFFLGEESRWAAVAADLAAEQNRFWALHDLFYANQMGENVGSFSLDRILSMAEAAGVEMETFRAGLVLDAARARYAQLERSVLPDAVAWQVDRTPTVIVNGVKLESPDWESVDAAIAAALAPAPSPAPSPAG